MIYYQFSQREKDNLINLCVEDTVSKLYQPMLYFEEGQVAKQVRWAAFDPEKTNAVYYRGLKVMETSTFGLKATRLARLLPRDLVRSGGLDIRNAVWFRVVGHREVPIHLDEAYLPLANRGREHILINLGRSIVTLDGVTVDTENFTHYFVFNPSAVPHGAKAPEDESSWFLQFPI